MHFPHFAGNAATAYSGNPASPSGAEHPPHQTQPETASANVPDVVMEGSPVEEMSTVDRLRAANRPPPVASGAEARLPNLRTLGPRDFTNIPIETRHGVTLPMWMFDHISYVVPDVRSSI